MGQLRGITFDETETFVFLGSGDGMLYRYDRSIGTAAWKLSTIAWPYTPPSLSPNGKWIAVGSKTGEVTVGDVDSGSCLAQVDLGIMTVRRARFLPDGSQLLAASGTGNGTVSYSTRDFRPLWAAGTSAEVTVTKDGSEALLADSSIAVLVDTKDGSGRAELDTGFANGANYFKVAYLSGDGRRAIIARRDTSPGAVNIAFFARNP